MCKLFIGNIGTVNIAILGNETYSVVMLAWREDVSGLTPTFHFRRMSLRLRDTYDLMYGDSVKKEEGGEELGVDQETVGFIKKKRRPANLCISCPVCGGPAPDHVHFGGFLEFFFSPSSSDTSGQCCYSCRAFFRRSSSRPVTSFRCRSGRNDCIITSGIKSCIPCRLTKCLQVRTYVVDSEEQDLFGVQIKFNLGAFRAPHSFCPKDLLLL